MKKGFSYFLCLLFLSGSTQLSVAQDQKLIDSLLKELPAAKEDTNKVILLNSIGWNISYINLGTGLKYCQQGLELGIKLNYEAGMSGAYYNMGSIYLDMGDYERSSDCFFKGLKLAEKLKNKILLSKNLLGIGSLYGSQKNYVQALHYDSLALKILSELKQPRAMSVCYINMGIFFSSMQKYDTALAYFNRSLQISLEEGDMEGLGNCYQVIGDLQLKKGDHKKAYTNIKLAIQFFRTQGLTYSLPVALAEMAEYYQKVGDNKTAIQYWDSAQGFMIANGQTEMLIKVYEGLSKDHEALGNVAKAYDYYKKYTLVKDSLFNEQKSKELGRKEMEYEFDKVREKQKADQEKKDAIADQEKARQSLILYSVVIGLIGVLIFAFYILRIYREKKLINLKLEETNILIAEKNKSITDSINYAKQIQDSIIPPEKAVLDLLPSAFVLFGPKDIVSGDFYWMEKVGDKILFAAVDCTGHGVPGAMVSVVGHNSLNRCIKEFKLTKPSAILDKLTELIEETFEKSEGSIKDGMDMALCSLNSKTLELEYAGANNPLWVIKSKSDVLEIKADKQPIGKFSERKPFTNHSVQLSKGDRLYIFSDGYADQFGGEKGKKFKYRSFQDLLISSYTLGMREQKKLLNDTIHNWMGELEQVDDILIIGIEV